MKKLIVIVLMFILFIPTVSADTYNIHKKVTIFSNYEDELPFILDGVLKAWRETKSVAPDRPAIWIVVDSDDSRFGYFHPLPDSALGFIFINPKKDLTKDDYIDRVSIVVTSAIMYYKYYKK